MRLAGRAHIWTLAVALAGLGTSCILSDHGGGDDDDVVVDAALPREDAQPSPDAASPPCALTTSAPATQAILTSHTGGLSYNLVSIDLTTLTTRTTPFRINGTRAPVPSLRVAGSCVFVWEADSGSGNDGSPDLFVWKASTLNLERTHTLSLVPRGSITDFALITPDRAYVTATGERSIVAINPSSGLGLGRISLSPLDDLGTSTLTSVVLAGGRAYVALQPPAGTPAGPGVLAVIDTSTDQLLDMDSNVTGVQGIRLSAPAAGPLQVAQGRVWVRVAGATPDSSCLESVEPSLRTSSGCLLRAADLGGPMLWFTMSDQSGGLATISRGSPGFETPIMRFSLAPVATAMNFRGESFGSVARAPNGLVFAEQTPSPGAPTRIIRVFRADSSELTINPIQLGGLLGAIGFAP